MIDKILTTTAAHSAVLWLQTSPPNPNTLTPEQQVQFIQAVSHGHGGTEILVPIALFAMIVLIVWIGNRRKQAMMQGQIELRKQLLDKFGSGQELAAFLESRAGQQFLQDMKWRAGNRGSWTWGLILTMVGLALLALNLAGRTHVLVPGVVLLAVGAALLISSLIHHRLANQSGPAVGSGPGNQPVLPS